MIKKKAQIVIFNPCAMDTDVDSKSHFISIEQDKNDVREFKVFTKDY